MTYDYDQHTIDGEQHLASAGQLEQSGFTIHEVPSIGDAGEGQDAPRDSLDWLFDGGLDLETPEGCERALREIRNERDTENV